MELSAVFCRILMTLLVCAILLRPEARAYEFSPIVAEFAPSGSGAARSFTVRNTQQEPVALQIEVFSRSADEAGAEVREPDFDNFIVTPPQLVLSPGAGRSVRVQWIGEPTPERELAFRFVVTQIPINFGQDSDGSEIAASVAIGYKYEVAAYVAPAGAKPEAVLESAEPVVDSEGKQRLRLTIRSTGTKRAILNQPTITLRTSEGQTVVLEGQSLPGLQTRNILSGTQSVVDVPWPDQISFGPVDASLETTYFSLN